MAKRRSRWLVLMGVLILAATGRADAEDSFSAFGVPRSDLLDTATIYPLASGTIPRPGLGRAARRTVWDRSYAWPTPHRRGVGRFRIPLR